jgi:hypothetical protein
MHRLPRPPFSSTLIAWLALVTLLLHAQTAPPTRTWTDIQGRTAEASFGGLQGTSVLLILKDGQTILWPLAQLSPDDRTFATSQNNAPTPTPPHPPAAIDTVLPKRLPPDQRLWPDKVEVSARTMDRLQLVLTEPQNRKYVYRTDAFEFASQDKLAGSVMTEVARTFEATRQLVSQLPWGIVCTPPPPLERYQAALYETPEDYFNNGGPLNSGGVYDSGDMIFKIPFPSLGLEQRGKTWFKNDSYRNDTLVHEITHQMMHDYLPYLPKWLIEGSAEYTELMPYNAGSFRVGSHKTGIKDYIAKMQGYGIALDLGSVQQHLTMTRSQWDAQSSRPNAQLTLYFRSALLVYFFNHLDGTGKGERFIHFFESVYGEVLATRNFFANPAVKRFPGGRFTYPTTLVAGRTYASLAAEITSAYRTNGIKLTATE